MNKYKELKKEMRNLLNDFFQDVDTEANINADVANVIVDVHLNKFMNLLTPNPKDECRERVAYINVIKLLDSYFDGLDECREKKVALEIALMCRVLLGDKDGKFMEREIKKAYINQEGNKDDVDSKV